MRHKSGPTSARVNRGGLQRLDSSVESCQSFLLPISFATFFRCSFNYPTIRPAVISLPSTDSLSPSRRPPNFPRREWKTGARSTRRIRQAGRERGRNQAEVKKKFASLPSSFRRGNNCARDRKDEKLTFGRHSIIYPARPGRNWPGSIPTRWDPKKLGSIDRATSGG